MLSLKNTIQFGLNKPMFNGSGDLYFSNIPPEIRQILMEKLSFPNPKWLENKRMGRWNRGTPKELRFFDKTREGLWIPRGYTRQLLLFCKQYGIEYQIDDQRRSLPPIGFNFTGELKPFQKKPSLPCCQKNLAS